MPNDTIFIHSPPAGRLTQPSVIWIIVQSVRKHLAVMTSLALDIQ